MREKLTSEAEKIFNERFKSDYLIALATATDGISCVHTVNVTMKKVPFI